MPIIGIRGTESESKKVDADAEAAGQTRAEYIRERLQLDPPHSRGRPRSYKLSPSMEQVLLNLLAGLDAMDHARGQSQHGGLSGTMLAMRRRKLVNVDSELTPAGKRIAENIRAGRDLANDAFDHGDLG